MERRSMERRHSIECRCLSELLAFIALWQAHKLPDLGCLMVANISSPAAVRTKVMISAPELQVLAASVRMYSELSRTGMRERDTVCSDHT
jgi:hypothetical protein